MQKTSTKIFSPPSNKYMVAGELDEKLLERRNELEKQGDQIILWELHSTLEQEIRRLNEAQPEAKNSYPYNPSNAELEALEEFERAIEKSQNLEIALDTLETQIQDYKNQTNPEINTPYKCDWNNIPSLYRNIMNKTLENLKTTEKDHRYQEALHTTQKIQNHSTHEINQALRSANQLHPKQMNFLRKLQHTTKTTNTDIQESYQELVEENPENTRQYTQAIKQVYQELRQN